MFLDCPAYLDGTGAAQCGLPAEVTCRFTMRSTDGPFESAMIRCPASHWFNGPIDSLTWQDSHKHDPGHAAGASGARDRLAGSHHGRDRGGGFTVRESSGTPGRESPARMALPPTIWGGPPACGSPS